MTTTRRGFLFASLAGLGALAVRGPVRAFAAPSAAAGPRTLVVVFQRGAVDGLAMVPPLGDAALAAARPSLAPKRDTDVAAFDAIVVAGGQAPMFTFEQATSLHEKFTEFFEAGKVASALCHGAAILAHAKR